MVYAEMIEEINSRYKCALCGYSTFGLVYEGNILYCKFCGRHIKDLTIRYGENGYEFFRYMGGEKYAID